MKKKVDTIKLVRQIRDDNYEKTKQLSRAEQFADIKKKVQKPGKNSCLILKQFKLDFKSILVSPLLRSGQIALRQYDSLSFPFLVKPHII